MHNLHYFSPQNVTYFIMLSFLVHKIFSFYIKGMPEFQNWSCCVECGTSSVSLQRNTVLY